MLKYQVHSLDSFSGSNYQYYSNSSKITSVNESGFCQIKSNFANTISVEVKYQLLSNALMSPIQAMFNITTHMLLKTVYLAFKIIFLGQLALIFKALL